MSTTEHFRNAASDLFGAFVTHPLIEQAEAGVFPHALWDAIRDAGFDAALVSEEHGGVGGSVSEVAAIFHEAGRHAAPGPLLELVVGRYLASVAGHANDDSLVALAITGNVNRRTPHRVRNVSWGSAAATVFFVARHEDGHVLVSLQDARDLCIHDEIPDVSGEPSSWVDIAAGMPWQALPDLAYDALVRQLSLLRASQMMGSMRWCLERTIQYTQERKQFGREIGRFQVVQQMMAECASAVVAADAILNAAIAAPDNAMLVAAARSRLGDAADVVSALSHQVHGAIGFSYEYALHFRTRRLMAWRDQFGSVASWRRLLAESLQGKSADDIWPFLST